MANDNEAPPKVTAVEVAETTPLNPATGAMVSMLAGILDELKHIRQGGLERQEMPAPGIYRTPFVQHVRLRVTKWLISVSAATTIELLAGTNRVFTAEFAAAGTSSIDLPIVIERGVDVSVAGAEVVDSVIVAFPE